MVIVVVVVVDVDVDVVVVVVAAPSCWCFCCEDRSREGRQPKNSKTLEGGWGEGCFLLLPFGEPLNRWAYAMLMYRPHFTV